jgi:hypothetical protein
MSSALKKLEQTLIDFCKSLNPNICLKLKLKDSPEIKNDSELEVINFDLFTKTFYPRITKDTPCSADYLLLSEEAIILLEAKDLDSSSIEYKNKFDTKESIEKWFEEKCFSNNKKIAESFGLLIYAADRLCPNNEKLEIISKILEKKN